MPISIKNKFELGDLVYVITDPMQYKGIVVKIAKCWNGGIEYEVAQHPDSKWFQAIELSKEMDLSITVSQIEDETDDDE